MSRVKGIGRVGGVVSDRVVRDLMRRGHLSTF